MDPFQDDSGSDEDVISLDIQEGDDVVLYGCSERKLSHPENHVTKVLIGPREPEPTMTEIAVFADDRPSEMSSGSANLAVISPFVSADQYDMPQTAGKSVKQLAQAYLAVQQAKEEEYYVSPSLSRRFRSSGRSEVVSPSKNPFLTGSVVLSPAEISSEPRPAGVSSVNTNVPSLNDELSDTVTPLTTVTSTGSGNLADLSGAPDLLVGAANPQALPVIGVISPSTANAMQESTPVGTSSSAISADTTAQDLNHPHQYPINLVQNPINPGQEPINCTQYRINVVQNPVNLEQNPINPVQNPTNPAENTIYPVQNPTIPAHNPNNPGLDSINLTQYPINPAQPPATSVQAPSNPTQYPINSAQNPINPVQTPINPGQDPINSTQYPINPVQNPTNPVQDPINLVQNPTNPAQNPINLAHDPVNSVQNPTNPAQNQTNSAQDPTIPTLNPTTLTMNPSIPTLSNSSNATSQINTSGNPPDVTFVSQDPSSSANPVSSDTHIQSLQNTGLARIQILNAACQELPPIQESLNTPFQPSESSFHFPEPPRPAPLVCVPVKEVKFEEPLKHKILTSQNNIQELGEIVPINVQPSHSAQNIHKAKDEEIFPTCTTAQSAPKTKDESSGSQANSNQNSNASEVKLNYQQEQEAEEVDAPDQTQEDPHEHSYGIIGNEDNMSEITLPPLGEHNHRDQESRPYNNGYPAHRIRISIDHQVATPSRKTMAITVLLVVLLLSTIALLTAYKFLHKSSPG